MQIYIGFICEECGHEERIPINYGEWGEIRTKGFWWVTGSQERHPVLEVTKAPQVRLECSRCAHISGEVALGYRYEA